MNNKRNSVDQPANTRNIKRRIPVSGNRDILTVKGIPNGFVGRWVNDVPGRIAKFNDAGYEFADKDGLQVGERTVDSSEGVDSRISKLVGKDDYGNPIYAYLMVQKKGWYDEDQQSKENDLLSKEQTMRNKEKSEGFYGSVKTSTKYVKEKLEGE